MNEIEILKQNLQTANTLIEQLNNQLGYMHNHFSLFWGITGIIMAIIGLFGYFQFIRPINKQKEEIKELNKQANDILRDLRGSIKSQIEKERFRIGIDGMKIYDLHENTGLSIIREFVVKGLTKDQLEEIDYFIRNEIQKISHKNHKNRVALNLLYALSLHQRNDILDKIFSDLKDKRLILSEENTVVNGYVRDYFRERPL